MYSKTQLSLMSPSELDEAHRRLVDEAAHELVWQQFSTTSYYKLLRERLGKLLDDARSQYYSIRVDSGAAVYELAYTQGREGVLLELIELLDGAENRKKALDDLIAHVRMLQTGRSK